MAEQTERAYQKQLGVNVGFKKPAKKVPGKGGLRYYKNVGLGFKTPREAIEGTVRSTKMNRTIVVRRDYLHYIKKYARYEKRHTNISAHLSPAFRCREGDTVVIGQCRPLSKTVRFNVLRVMPQGSGDSKKFSSF
eukprot:jgi/Chrzof1/7125/Cz02g12020.t1